MNAAAIVAVLAAVAGAFVLKGQASSTSFATPKSFADGGKFWTRFSADFARAGAPEWLDRAMSYTVAEIETDFGRSNALGSTNSYFNRHVGTGRGEWTGHAHTTTPPAGRDPEVLRIYSDRPQSVRDFAQLEGDSEIYVRAYRSMCAGDADGFFVGLVQGDGKNGYVGAASSAKAAAYLAGLRARYARSFA